MDRDIFPSQVLANAVHEISNLPGIGKKSALRLALHILKQDKNFAHSLGSAIIRLSDEIIYCKTCNNISDSDICSICENPSRDHSTVCVVEGMRDVMSIDHTRQYRGVYHVLGGLISPMDGVSPSDLHIESLLERLKTSEVTEVIFALSATMEGDTTNFYLYKKIKDFNVKISTIARGVPIGDELEYTDEITLGRSILNRTEFKIEL